MILIAFRSGGDLVFELYLGDVVHMEGKILDDCC
jgi:hypothetical protein